MNKSVPSAPLSGPVLLSSRWVIGHQDGKHAIFENGCVVYENDTVIFVGHDYQGDVAHRFDYGTAIISPGFIDLDALSDIDTTILSFDNQPSWKKGASGQKAIWNAALMKCTPQKNWLSKNAILSLS